MREGEKFMQNSNRKAGDVKGFSYFGSGDNIKMGLEK